MRDIKNQTMTPCFIAYNKTNNIIMRNGKQGNRNTYRVDTI